jgi:hypothetical protein
MSKRPGYKRQAPLYVLKFEDPQFEGLEVAAKSMPLGEFLALQKLQQAAQTDPDAQEQVIRKLAEVIHAWNLEDADDKPVPVTYEALLRFDMPFVLSIFYAWMEAVADIPNLSRPNSNSGETSRELSLPMEVSSPSPPG